MTRLSRRRFVKSSAAAAGLLGLRLPFASRAAASSGLDKVSCQLGWKRLAQFGGHFMAQELGYFEEEGIEAEFLSGGPNIDAFSTVYSGQADIGDANGSGILLEAVGGAPVKAFCTIFQVTPNALMSLEDNPITRMRELEGMTVAVPTGEIELIDVLVANDGGDPSTVNYVPVGTDPAILTSGEVDAYIGYGTSQGVALQAAGVPVIITYFGDLGNPDYGNAIFGTTELIEEKFDVLTRWLRADIKGWEYAVANPEEMATRVWELYNQETAALLEDEITTALVQVDLIDRGPTKAHGLMWIEPETFQIVGELYQAAGLLEGDIDYASVMTQDLLVAVGAAGTAPSSSAP